MRKVCGTRFVGSEALLKLGHGLRKAWSHHDHILHIVPFGVKCISIMMNYKWRDCRVAVWEERLFRRVAPRNDSAWLIYTAGGDCATLGFMASEPGAGVGSVVAGGGFAGGA